MSSRFDLVSFTKERHGIIEDEVLTDFLPSLFLTDSEERNRNEKGRREWTPKSTSNNKQQQQHITVEKQESK